MKWLCTLCLFGMTSVLAHTSLDDSLNEQPNKKSNKYMVQFQGSALVERNKVADSQEKLQSAHVVADIQQASQETEGQEKQQPTDKTESTKPLTSQKQVINVEDEKKNKDKEANTPSLHEGKEANKAEKKLPSIKVMFEKKKDTKAVPSQPKETEKKSVERTSKLFDSIKNIFSSFKKKNAESTAAATSENAKALVGTNGDHEQLDQLEKEIHHSLGTIYGAVDQVILLHKKVYGSALTWDKISPFQNKLDKLAHKLNKVQKTLDQGLAEDVSLTDDENEKDGLLDTYNQLKKNERQLKLSQKLVKMIICWKNRKDKAKGGKVSTKEMNKAMNQGEILDTRKSNEQSLQDRNIDPLMETNAGIQHAQSKSSHRKHSRAKPEHSKSILKTQAQHDALPSSTTMKHHYARVGKKNKKVLGRKEKPGITQKTQQSGILPPVIKSQPTKPSRAKSTISQSKSNLAKKKVGRKTNTAKSSDEQPLDFAKKLDNDGQEALWYKKRQEERMEELERIRQANMGNVKERIEFYNEWEENEKNPDRVNTTYLESANRLVKEHIARKRSKLDKLREKPQNISTESVAKRKARLLQEKFSKPSTMTLPSGSQAKLNEQKSSVPPSNIPPPPPAPLVKPNVRVERKVSKAT